MSTTTILVLNGWSESWFAAMLAVLWQSTALIVVVALAAWWLRRSSPSLRYWLWQIVAVKLLLMPLWTYAVPAPSWAKIQPTAATNVSSQIAAQSRRVEYEPAQNSTPSSDASVVKADARAAVVWNALAAATWQMWLFIIWAAIVVWQVVRLLVQRQRLRAVLRHGGPVGEEVTGLVAELARQVGLRRAPAVVLAAGDCPLFVCGLWRPTLVLPASLRGSLPAENFRQALLHELAHLKRHDLIWGWPIEIARIAYCFHPLVYWVANQLRLERELACDQWAMVHSGRSAAEYAQTLIQVVES
jgi:beta-lactamase regulating signal transducer with metallopeptidase domain